MITVNGIEIVRKTFPDGSLCLLDLDNSLLYPNKNYEIVWLYEGDYEIFMLICIVKHLRSKMYNNVSFNLTIPYVVNSRLDRTHSDNEVFTLKYFAEIINDLKFNKVVIVDPHSIVSEALIDNVCVLRPSNIISNVIDTMRSLNEFKRELVIYFPDDGAYKRYKDMPCFKDFNCIYGKKERDWETGKILGIEIYDKNGSKLTNELENCDVLMVDDIISYGGTLAYSADKLKEMGATHISAYATHVENSVLDEEKGTLLKRYKDNIIDTVYTTNSIYHGNHPMVEVIYKFQLWKRILH